MHLDTLIVFFQELRYFVIFHLCWKYYLLFLAFYFSRFLRSVLYIIWIDQYFKCLSSSSILKQDILNSAVTNNGCITPMEKKKAAAQLWHLYAINCQLMCYKKKLVRYIYQNWKGAKWGLCHCYFHLLL